MIVQIQDLQKKHKIILKRISSLSFAQFEQVKNENNY